MRPCVRFVVMLVFASFQIVGANNSGFAQGDNETSDNEIMRRLDAKVDALVRKKVDALLHKKLDALVRENSVLKDRVRQLEANKKSSIAVATPATVYAQAPAGRGEGRLGSALAQANTWTGFYVGVNAGYGWGDPTTSTSNDSPSTASNSSVFVPLNPAQYTVRNNGGIGGVEGGFNYQIGRSVFGVEADFNLANINGSIEKSAVCSGFTGLPLNCSYSQSQKLDWLATARGRFGFAIVPETLIYGTGGFAFGHVSVSDSLQGTSFGIVRTASDSTAKTNTGWVAGAGIESMIMPNWIVRLEFMHYDLGTVSSTATILSSGIPSIRSTRADFRVNGDFARGGLIYKF